MTRRVLAEDPTYYRIEYMRIAQLLHQECGRMGSAQSRMRFDKLSRLTKRTVDEIAEELTEEQKKHAAKGLDKDAGTAELLSEQALELLATIVKELHRLRWYWVGRTPPWYLRWLGLGHRKRRLEYMRLAEFLDQIVEPAIVVLYFSCLVEKKEEGLRELPDLNVPSAQKIFKRNRRHAFKSGRDHHELDPQWLNAYLAYLCTWQAPKPKPRWSQPLALVPWLIVKMLAWLGIVPLRPSSGPSYRVRYNLACFFSRLASHLDEEEKRASLYEARLQLRLCIEALSGQERVDIAEWAEKDPALTELRSGDGDWVSWVTPSGGR